MKKTVIPAQITTVEDKIAGNLSFTQILLFLAPLFVSTFIYVVLPTKLTFNTYKLILIFVNFFVFIILAVRIKGKLILNWIAVILSYLYRPNLYVFDKNDLYLREVYFAKHKKKVKIKKLSIKKSSPEGISTQNLAVLEEILTNKRKKIAFKFSNK